MELSSEQIIPGATLFGIAIAFAKGALSRSLKDLDYVMLKVNEILVKLQKLDCFEGTLKEHSEKIAHLEASYEIRKKAIRRTPE